MVYTTLSAYGNKIKLNDRVLAFPKIKNTERGKKCMYLDGWIDLEETTFLIC